MLARQVERLLEVSSCRRRGSGHTPRQQKLALDAQQLGIEPTFFGGRGADDRLLECGERVGDLPRMARGRNYEERSVPRGVPD